MKRMYITMMLMSLGALAQNYPVTKKTGKSITKHETTFTDDYSWLENMRSPDVNVWVNSQNKLTESHIQKISASIYPLPKIRKYANQTNYRIPVKKGEYYYAGMRIYGEELQTPSFGYKKTIEGAYVELFNPNFFTGIKLLT